MSDICQINKTLFITDQWNHLIRTISIQSSSVVTLIGNPKSHGYNDGFGTNAQFNLPLAITSDSSDNLYVLEEMNKAIRKISLSNYLVTTFITWTNDGSADGSFTQASFFSPQDISSDRNGNLFMADTLNCKIRKVWAIGEYFHFIKII